MSYLFTGRNYNFEDHKNKRKLEERSHLTLEFPQTNNRIFRTYIPFLENPQISEAGSNSLQEYNLMGRAGSLFAYGGSESRAFDITFNISLLHLLYVNSTEGLADKFHRHFNLFFADKQSAKERFDLKASITSQNERLAQEEGDMMDGYATGDPGIGTTSPSLQRHDMSLEQATANSNEIQKAQGQKLGIEDTSFNPAGFPHAQTHRAFYSQWIRKITGQNFVESFLDLHGFVGTGKPPVDLDKIINLVYVWVNLVRATCLNNATNTVQGPPIVRLTHGPMYNNIPCVVRDYSISIMDEVGYDIQTLTPKRLEITMTLSEMRTGDWGGFQEGWLESGDNLAGWEAIINNNNGDPYNGDVTLGGVQIGDDVDGVVTTRTVPGSSRELGRSFAD